LITEPCTTIFIDAHKRDTGKQRYLRQKLTSGYTVATALTGYIGYDKASEVAIFCLNTGKTVREAVLELGFLDEKTLSEVLRPERLTAPGTTITKEK
jgi:aspartate ammonia-lyase